ncbi:Zn-dependent alcohol dehydrogenase [Rhodococcus jostii]|uniref:Zn-dependent alcohol dehydrogenase n=1 Tax=Rhodococcus jostii TaxID=132919 RepID=UPI0036345A24
MRAAVLNSAPGKLELEDLTMDDPGPREVVIRTAAVGLCHSDLHYIDATWSTDLPEVLGHEVAGVVAAVGSEVSSVRPGDHVVTCATIFCGYCRYCTNGQLSLCLNHQALRTRPRPKLTNAAGRPVGTMGGLGGFADSMLVHENGVVKIDEAMPFDRACLLGCSIVTGVGAVFRGAQVQPGSTVAVIGCGGVGIAAIQGARLAGASQIIAIDVNEHALEQAKFFGATSTVNGREVDSVEAVRELTGGGVDYSFEAIGVRVTAEQAVTMLAPGGVATILGMVPDEQPLRIPSSEFFMKEKRIQGSLFGSNQFMVDIPRFVDYYLQGRLRLDEMVSGRIRLDEINDGFDAMRQGGITRVVVEFDQ